MGSSFGLNLGKGQIGGDLGKELGGITDSIFKDAQFVKDYNWDVRAVGAVEWAFYGVQGAGGAALAAGSVGATAASGGSLAPVGVAGAVIGTILITDAFEGAAIASNKVFTGQVSDDKTSLNQLAISACDAVSGSEYCTQIGDGLYNVSIGVADGLGGIKIASLVKQGTFSHGTKSINFKADDFIKKEASPNPNIIDDIPSKAAGDSVDHLFDLNNGLKSDIEDWNEYQAVTKGRKLSRAEAAEGWDLYKQKYKTQIGEPLSLKERVSQWQWFSTGKFPRIIERTDDGMILYRDPLSNKIKKIPEGSTVTIDGRPWEMQKDHIVPKKTIEDMGDSFGLSLKEIERFINDPENLQWMPKTLNCSKGAKCISKDQEWTTYKDKLLSPKYSRGLVEEQDKIIKRFRNDMQDIADRKKLGGQ